MPRTHTVFIRNYTAPFPQKWLQILWAFDPLNIIEYPGDENGPFTIAQYSDFCDAEGANVAIATYTTSCGHPIINRHASDTDDFAIVIQEIGQVYLNGFFENSCGNYYAPLADASARMSNESNRLR